jgi:hypothetical protein
MQGIFRGASSSDEDEEKIAKKQKTAKLRRGNSKKSPSMRSALKSKHNEGASEISSITGFSLQMD